MELILKITTLGIIANVIILGAYIQDNLQPDTDNTLICGTIV